MQVKIERKVGVLDLGSNTFNIKFVTFKNREVRSIFKYKKYINIIASTNSDGNIQKNKRESFFKHSMNSKVSLIFRNRMH